MRIGLAYDLKQLITQGQCCPEDALEEYDSPETIDAIASVLESCGNTIIKLGGGREFLANITQNPVDIVFNISEGLGNYRSREAQVPSVLEMLDIPYVGADPLCLAVCLGKPLTKKLLAASGIVTPKWAVINRIAELDDIDWSQFPFPVFVKPAHEGSSKGIRLGSRIDNIGNLLDFIRQLLENYRQPVMVEECIDGDEITVGITGNKPPRVMGIMRVLPKTKMEHFIYSLEIKRDWENLVSYECPARLAPDVMEQIEISSLKIFRELGCRDFARIDYKVSREGIPYFLEINPLAGLNPKSSDLPIMAGKLGKTYRELIMDIFNAALDRYPNCVLK